MVEAKAARDERLLRLAREASRKRAEVEQHLREICGRILPEHAVLLDALYDVELVRLEAMEYLSEKGQRERYSNGRQTLDRKCPEVDTMLKASATQAKLIAALGAKPRKGKKAGEDTADGKVMPEDVMEDEPSLDYY